MAVNVFTPEGKKFTLDAAASCVAGSGAGHSPTLAEAIWLSGEVSAPPLCSGLGRCGRCRVRFASLPPPATEAEKDILGADVAHGWRLACRHELREIVTLWTPCAADEAPSLAKDVEIHLPPAPLPRRVLMQRQDTTEAEGAQQGKEAVLLAVDLGTTSLHWRAVDKAGNTLAEGQELNPQMGAGSDVMSRLAAASRPGGLRCLSHLTTTALSRIMSALPPVAEVCLAANTAMTAITLQKDIATLARAPYALPLEGNSTEALAALPPVYVPPQMAPFVGGDISAGCAFLLMRQDLEFPFLLADLGTNGEFVLAVSREKAYMASVPLGPSLEGIGLTFGDMADATKGRGIVHAVSLSPAGLVPHMLAKDAQDERPQRLCGTGYLSLVHALLRAGVLGRDGRWSEGPSPLFRKLGAATQRGKEMVFPLWGDMYLAGGDVEEILKVKAAFSLAMSKLLTAAELKASDLRNIWLAGAMGSHVQPEDLEALGFVPAGAGARIKDLGNASLSGAVLLLLQPEQRDALTRWCRACTLVPLAEQDDFMENYLQHMLFA